MSEDYTKLDSLFTSFKSDFKNLMNSLFTSAKNELDEVGLGAEKDYFIFGIVSAIIELKLFNFSFLKKPQWPLTVPLIIKQLCELDETHDAVQSSEMTLSIEMQRLEKGILLVKDSDFATMVCNYSFSKKFNLDYSLLFSSLIRLFNKQCSFLLPLIEKYEANKGLINMYVLDCAPFGFCWKASTVFDSVLDELKESNSGLDEDNCGDLVFDAMENIAEELVANNKVLVPQLIDLFNEYFDNVPINAHKYMDWHNSNPFNAKTDYYHWLILELKRLSYKGVSLLSQEEKNHAIKEIALDVFKDNLVIKMMYGQIINNDDPELYITESTYLYYKFIWEELREELKLDSIDCQLLSFCFCALKQVNNFDEIKDNLFLFLTTAVCGEYIVDDKKYIFHQIVPDSLKYTHEGFIFCASIASNIALTQIYPDENSRDYLDYLFSRASEIESHIEDLTNGRVVLGRENDELELMRNNRDLFIDNLLAFKELTDEYKKNVKKALSGNDLDKKHFENNSERLKFVPYTFNMRFYNSLGFCFLKGVGFKSRLFEAYNKMNSELVKEIITNVFENTLTIEKNILTTLPSKKSSEIEVHLESVNEINSISVEIPDCIYEPESKYVSLVWNNDGTLRYYSAELFEESDDLGLCFKDEHGHYVLSKTMNRDIDIIEFADICINDFPK